MLHLRRIRPHTTTRRYLSSSSPSSISTSPSIPNNDDSPPPPPPGEEQPQRKSFYLYYNLVFPLRTSLLDPRSLLTQFQRPQLIQQLNDLSKHVIQINGNNNDKENETGGRGLKFEEIETREKDGGAFVRYSYVPSEGESSSSTTTTETIEREVEKQASLALSTTDPSPSSSSTKTPLLKPWFTSLYNPLLPSLIVQRKPETFLVRGKPWMEDMNRFPARELIVEFEGPEIPQERLYELFRPYGKIHDIVPVSPKSASIIYTSLRSSTSARNCLHSTLISPSSPNVTSPTLIRILYRPKKHFSQCRDWITSHPKIVLPLIVALLGTVSYAVFDPVREWFIKTKVSGTFNVDQYRALRWLKRETLGRFVGRGGSSYGLEGTTMSGIEREREDAKEELKGWLKGVPESFVTVQGPRGSGKTRLVEDVLKDGKNILVIDCKKICKSARSDAKLVSELATAVGYYPQFVLASSLNNMIDLAAVGLIGQKAGFSSNLDTQLKAILEVTASALSQLSTQIRNRSLAAVNSSSSTNASDRRHQIELRKEVALQLERQGGAVHDGRLETVAGNGPMSELGVGVEAEVPSLSSESTDTKKQGDGEKEVIEGEKVGGKKLEIVGPRSSQLVKEASQTVREGRVVEGEGGEIKIKEREMERLPVVVIKGFAAKGETKQEVLWDVLAEFAAVLVENQIAHVIFTSDSPTLAKPLAKALPSKPFNAITLTDASPEASLEYLEAKLSSFSQPLAVESHSSLSRLGGRQTDLELLISKVRAGQTVEEAVEDIVTRSASEIRKNFFGDDEEEAKSLKWSRNQAAAIVEGLCDKGELKYAETLLKTFGGDEAALRALENAEMISITHREGRPSVIKPGRPVYRSAFSLLLSDPIFRSTLSYRTVLSSLASAQTDLKQSQSELIELSKLFVPETGKWTFGGGSKTPREIEVRVKKTLEKMRTAEDKIEELGKEKTRLLKILAETD